MQPYVLKKDVLEKASHEALVSSDFEKQIVETRKRVYRLALQMLGNRSDAEDVTQETLVRAWSGLARYDPARSFDAWLLRIATNLCIDQLRRSRRRAVVSLDTPAYAEPDDQRAAIDLADLSHNPEKVLLDKEIDERLLSGIRSLPATYHHCVQMVEQGRSYEEIAEQLHCPLGTVRSRVHRARAHLRRVMAA